MTSSTLPLPFPEPHRYRDFNKYYWSDNTLPLDHDRCLEVGDASLTNIGFYTTTHTQGEYCFMIDDHLNTAFALLSQDKNCDESSIAILSTYVAEIIYRAETTAGQEQYTALYGDKKWIFMPVNNGFEATVNDGTKGAHWSLVALDRVHKCMHYYDSLFMGQEAYMFMAKRIADNMLQVLGEDIAQWEFLAEVNCPDQYHYNNCKDGGACGPFVYDMVMILVNSIKGHQHEGKEDWCTLRLHDDFPGRFGSWWSSENTRVAIQRRMLQEMMGKDIEGWAAQHDRQAVEGEDVKFFDEPAVTFEVPRWDSAVDSDADSRCSDVSERTDSVGASMVVSSDSDSEEEEASSSPQQTAFPDPDLQRTASAEEGEGNDNALTSSDFTEEVVSVSSDKAENVFLYEV